MARPRAAAHHAGRRRHRRPSAVARCEGQARARRPGDAGGPRRDPGHGRCHEGPGAGPGRLHPSPRRSRGEPLLALRRGAHHPLARPDRGLRRPQAALMAYRAIFFDLFDTLVSFERHRLPVVEIDGKSVRSTVATLHAVLCAHVPHVTLDGCYAALQASWQEAERLRAIDHREVSARERFADFFKRLALDPRDVPDGLDVALIDAHRAELAKAAAFPAHHRPLLERLARGHQLAVVSNFDYSPTALAILEAGGVRELFSAIVVSDEVGWRKPRAD